MTDIPPPAPDSGQQSDDAAAALPEGTGGVWAAGARGLQVGDHNVQINQFFTGTAIPDLAHDQRVRPGPWRVFLSHTGELTQYPAGGSFVAAAKRAVERSGHAAVEMDTWTASPHPPAQVCLDRLESCDVYVGVIGFRYGSPVRDDPARSYTELEFDTATSLAMPRLVFVLDENADLPLPRSALVDREFGDRQDAFRTKIDGSGVTRAAITSPQQLEMLLYQALVELAAVVPVSSGGAPADSDGRSIAGAASVVVVSAEERAFYLARVRERYRRLELDALTPAERDEGVPVMVGQVFVPQSVRPGAPPVEISKELWRRLVEADQVPEEDRPEVIEAAKWKASHELLRAQDPRPVLEVLTDPASRLAMVLGDPGSGKSTLARYLALALAGADDVPPGAPAPAEALGRYGSWLPVLVELRAYADDRGRWQSFTEYVDYLYRAGEGPGLPGQVLDGFLRETGQAWVIFDGLDELFDPKTREAVARQITGFAARYPLTRILVTSRPIGSERSRQILHGAGFAVHTLQDLTIAQIQEFLTAWYRVAYPDQTDRADDRRQRLLTSIGASSSIRELAGNPLLLTILAIIGKGRELPRERHAVYAHAASVLVYHWDVDRHLHEQDIDAEPLDVHDRTELLRRIAALIQSTRTGLAGNHIDSDTLTDAFRDYLIDRYQYAMPRACRIAAAMLRQLRERNFILSLYGAGIYGFVH